MRISIFLAGASLIALSACAPDGHYDKNGNFIPDTAYIEPAPVPAAGPTMVQEESYTTTPNPYDGNTVVKTTTRTYTYDQGRGYYDYTGAYISADNRLNVPARMFPPRGMCRVWFPERSYADQPTIESCTNIRYRVPAGSYIVYGG